MEHTNFPSQFKHGDSVRLNFQAAGEVTGCKITEVSFTNSKVKYDVEITATYNDSLEKFVTRVHGIDSCFVVAE